MSSKKRSRYEPDLKSSNYGERPKNRKPQSSSPENEVDYSPVRKRDRYDNNNLRKKDPYDRRRYDDEEKYDRRQHKHTRDENESKKKRRYESEEMERFTRKSYNTDEKDSRKYDRDPSNSRQKKTVGSRYYGEPVHDRQIEHQKDRTDKKDVIQSSNSNTNENDSVKETTNVPGTQKKAVDMLTSRTGGAYIPPAKLRMMQAQITDKSSAAYQRIVKENIVRGRGLLCRSIIQAQAASPTFTHVYAALVSVINSKFPNIGELLLRRLVIQFKRGFKRNDKSICISAATFIAHLVNQRVAHEIVALEILTLLIESPTDDSVEVAIAFLKECGMKLMEVSSKGMNAIFEMLRNILHEGQLDKRVQYMIEVIYQVRKDEFRDHEAVIKDLELVEEEDQFTHLVTLDEAKEGEDILNVFKFDAEYEANEVKYAALRKEILDESSSDSGSESGSEEESDSEEESENDENKEATIIDNTETNLVALRRTIYLTIHSSLDFEECAHKLMRMELKPGQEIELCHMFLDCCAEQRTYEKFFGLLAQRFCQINKIFIPPFEQIFRDTYDTIHRLDTNKLRNVAKIFAHLLFTDAISWEVLSHIHLNEEETTSSSRIFIKILFQELSEYMGLTKLNERVKDPSIITAFDGLFPRNDPKNTRFAINFFTSIGLGGLTDELRDHLKSQPKVALVPKLLENLASDSSDTDSDDSSDSSDSSSDSSDDESDDSEDTKQKSRSSKKNKKQKDVKKRYRRMHKTRLHFRASTSILQGQRSHSGNLLITPRIRLNPIGHIRKIIIIMNKFVLGHVAYRLKKKEFQNSQFSPCSST
ncbi:hypothetical protein L9F63_010382, partial [Diploptera punctata]